jgi:cysteine desulfurase
VRTGTPLSPIIDGGGQEFKRRAGTENVPGIVGIATALRLAVEERASAAEHCLRLRTRIVEGIMSKIPHAILNGHPIERHPNNVHVTFDYLEGNAATESILVQLDAQGVCASTGSACNSRALEPSHVLKAIGLTPSRAFSSLRLTVGRENTDSEIERVLQILPGIVERLRKASPAYQRFLAQSGV